MAVTLLLAGAYKVDLTVVYRHDTPDDLTKGTVTVLRLKPPSKEDFIASSGMYAIDMGQNDYDCEQTVVRFSSK